jgi:hypothetical protein
MGNPNEISSALISQLMANMLALIVTVAPLTPHRIITAAQKPPETCHASVTAYYVIAPRNDWFNSLSAANALLARIARAATCFLLILSSKDRRFYRTKPWSISQFFVGLEVELYFQTCWDPKEVSFARGGTTSSVKKLLLRWATSIFHLFGFFLDGVINVSRG